MKNITVSSDKMWDHSSYSESGIYKVNDVTLVWVNKSKMIVSFLPNDDEFIKLLNQPAASPVINEQKPEAKDVVRESFVLSLAETIIKSIK
jgi:hypothetical protein